MVGIAVVDKPGGITSNDLIYRVRRALRIRRIGHVGTLDPQATGVLVIAVGHATRVLRYLPTEPKVYEAEITFGVETDTQDAEGAIVGTSPVDTLSLQAVRQAASNFVGELYQLPPMFSAVKREGRPLYERARQGLVIEREPKSVRVDSFEIRDYVAPKATAKIVCSSGTYVRTLAHDLGNALGCGAHLSALRRTAVGKFKIEDAVAPENLSPESLIPIERALEPMPSLRLTRDQAIRIRNGQAIALSQLPDEELCGFLDERGRFLAVAKNQNNLWQPLCVIPEGAYE